MSMHVMTGGGMRQHGLIRKPVFVAQCRWGAGLTDILA